MSDQVRRCREARLFAARAWQFAEDYATEEDLEHGLLELDDPPPDVRWYARWAYQAQVNGVDRLDWIDEIAPTRPRERF